MLDGDTFRIKSGDRIRLVGIDAPEKDECGFLESKKELEEWVLGEVIELREERKDFWGRRLGLVYTNDVLINEEMVKYGFAILDGSANSQQEILKKASDKAMDTKEGIIEKCSL